MLTAYIYSLIMCFTATFLLSHHIGVAWAPWVFAALVATALSSSDAPTTACCVRSSNMPPHD